jgi:hypothetical protein
MRENSFLILYLATKSIETKKKRGETFASTSFIVGSPHSASLSMQELFRWETVPV